MTTTKAQQAHAQATKRAGFLFDIQKKVHSLRFYGLQSQLIVPYVILTLLLAFIGIFIITRLVVFSETDAFVNRMAEASRVAGDNIVRHERDQLEQMRLMIWTEGMAQAIFNRDTEKISDIVQPYVISRKFDVVTAVDLNGEEILTFGTQPGGQEFRSAEGSTIAGLPMVKSILSEQIDADGDKYVGLVELAQGWTLFTSAPVRDESGKLSGVILAGTYLDRLIDELRAQSTADYMLVIDQEQQILATDLDEPEEGFGPLLRIAKETAMSGLTNMQEVQINGRTYQVAYSPLVIRGRQIGRLGIILNTEQLISSILVSRNQFIILFFLGTVMVFILGYLLARSLARPILKLRDLSQAVAEGDLNQHISIHRDDEIGELADAFGTMTVKLKDRTEEAARLYAVTQQRNRELVEINDKLEQTQLQLIQSEKLASIGQLTAGIVHDVKNPFAVIMGMAEVLAEDENLDEPTRHSLRVMRESAVKGNKIVTDLLKFARQQQPEMRYADMRETVEAATRLTAYLTRPFNLVKELPDTSVMMTFDSQQIEQVLINMIHNAIQATEKHGLLRIALQQHDEEAHLIIQDSGCGIAPEHLRRIFDPFFTTKAEGQGTGLGLSTSYGIIKNHGGRIDVESEVGKGTTFTIVMPAVQPNFEAGEIAL